MVIASEPFFLLMASVWDLGALRLAQYCAKREQDFDLTRQEGLQSWELLALRQALLFPNFQRKVAGNDLCTQCMGCVVMPFKRAEVETAIMLFFGREKHTYMNRVWHTQTIDTAFFCFTV